MNCPKDTDKNEYLNSRPINMGNQEIIIQSIKGKIRYSDIQDLIRYGMNVTKSLSDCLDSLRASLMAFGCITVSASTNIKCVPRAIFDN